MLIVARRKGQRIVLGPDIEVIVTEISRNTVKLGVVAPSSCSILRGEVHDAIVEANRGAALSAFEPFDASRVSDAPDAPDASAPPTAPGHPGTVVE